MKTWKFFAVRTERPDRFGWRWREEGGGSPARESERAFELYFECVENAREHGYSGPNPRPQSFGGVGESHPLEKP